MRRGKVVRGGRLQTRQSLRCLGRPRGQRSPESESPCAGCCALWPFNAQYPGHDENKAMLDSRVETCSLSVASEGQEDSEARSQRAHAQDIAPYGRLTLSILSTAEKRPCATAESDDAFP